VQLGNAGEANGSAIHYLPLEVGMIL
jgi:hypothetical protein